MNKTLKIENILKYVLIAIIAFMLIFEIAAIAKTASIGGGLNFRDRVTLSLFLTYIFKIVFIIVGIILLLLSIKNNSKKIFFISIGLLFFALYILSEYYILIKYIGAYSFVEYIVYHLEHYTTISLLRVAGIGENIVKVLLIIITSVEIAKCVIKPQIAVATSDNNEESKKEVNAIENTENTEEVVLENVEKLDESKVDILFMQYKDLVPSEKALQLKEVLSKMNKKKYDSLIALQLKSPTTTLLLSIFLGGLGVDRFYIGDTGLGVAKLLLGAFTLGIWPLVDIFMCYKKVKEINYNNIIQICK